MDETAVQDPRPPWGKGEIITSALKRQALQHKVTRAPTAAEIAFKRDASSQRLASVQAELQNTYIARQFKKHLDGQGDAIPEFLKGVTEEKNSKRL